MKILDISVPVSETTPLWPGDPAFQLREVLRLEQGDDCDLSEVTMCTHCGTHLDAPAHFVPGGGNTASIPLETLIGPAEVLSFPNVSGITAALLESVSPRIQSKRVLFKTKNSSFWRSKQQPFREDFCALSEDAAQWLAEQNIRLVGIDYVSIEPYTTFDGAVHKILLENTIVILEGLNLTDVLPGCYQLVCLPLALKNAEGAPCRAVLIDP